MARLGDTLRERRLALGISLDDAQDSIRVRRRILEAIEDGNYERLPNPGYVRGYISSYARLLELDPTPLLNMYRAETGETHGHDLRNLPQRQEAVVPMGQQHIIPWRTGVAAMLILGVLSLSIWGITRIWAGRDRPPVAPVTPEQAVPTPAPQETVPEETAKVDAAPEAPAQKAPFTLEVKVKPDRTSWIVIEVDGSRAYAGMLGSDQAKMFEVTDEASVEVGKPQFVNITRDGEDVAIPIKKGIGLLELKAEVPKQ